MQHVVSHCGICVQCSSLGSPSFTSLRLEAQQESSDTCTHAVDDAMCNVVSMQIPVSQDWAARQVYHRSVTCSRYTDRGGDVVEAHTTMHIELE